MPNIFLTADQHFGHTNIIKYCDRPFKDVDEMEHTLIINHNNMVDSNDIVYMLGDFTMSRNVSYVRRLLKRLNGIKILILGNHDYLRPREYLNAGFLSVHTTLPFKDDIIFHHDPVASITSKDDRWLCGHVHEMFLKCNNAVNVGVDVWNFTPVSLNKALSLFKLPDTYIERLPKNNLE